MSKKIKIVNRNTGEFFLIDNQEAKNRRKRRKITSWMKYHQESVNLGKQRLKPYDAIFVTLTYNRLETFENGQIRAYIKLIKERLKSKLVAYAWVCENQKRGVPHYHIMFIVKKGVKIRKPDQGDWSYGQSNIQKCIKGLYYIISYLKKDLDSILHPGSRCFAVYSNCEVLKLIKMDCLPTWIIQELVDNLIHFNRFSEFKKVNGGFIVDQVFYKSPFKPIVNICTGMVQTY